VNHRYLDALRGMFDSLTRESGRGGVYFSRGHSGAAEKNKPSRHRRPICFWLSARTHPDGFAFREITRRGESRAFVRIDGVTAHQSGYTAMEIFQTRIAPLRSCDIHQIYK